MVMMTFGERIMEHLHVISLTAFRTQNIFEDFFPGSMPLKLYFTANGKANTKVLVCVMHYPHIIEVRSKTEKQYIKYFFG